MIFLNVKQNPIFINIYGNIAGGDTGFTLFASIKKDKENNNIFKIDQKFIVTLCKFILFKSNVYNETYKTFLEECKKMIEKNNWNYILTTECNEKNVEFSEYIVLKSLT